MSLGMIKEFRDFISRGNVMDMAVGIIMGAAFTTIVQSMVDDVMMPVIGVLTSGVDFSNLFVNLSGQDYASVAEAKKAGAATINYGLFLNAIVRFLIVSFAIFILIKWVNKLRRLGQAEQEAAAKAAVPAAPPRNEVLLEEIRDLLKTRS